MRPSKILLSILLCLFSASFCYAQSESHNMPDINVEGTLGGENRENGGNPNPGGNGGNGGNRGGNASPSRSVTAGPAGRFTVSQTVVDALINLMNDFYGTGFFSSLFSPSSLPGDAMKLELQNQLDDLATEAEAKGRRADADFIRQIKHDLILKSNILYNFNPVASPSSQNAMAAALLLPIITHNVTIHLPHGSYPGMSIAIPGTIINAQQSRTGEIIVRFYMPDGNPLLANLNEPFFKDRDGLVVAGSGPIQITTNNIPTGNYTILIPYYALNLAPTNGVQQYNLRARATAYVNFNQVVNSGFTPLFVRY